MVELSLAVELIELVEFIGYVVVVVVVFRLVCCCMREVEKEVSSPKINANVRCFFSSSDIGGDVAATVG
jgi:hypothetical protein